MIEKINNKFNIKVLFWVRLDFYEFPGGDKVQVESFKEALECLGHEVIISNKLDIDISHFNVIHLWHLERVHDTWLFFQKAKLKGIPVLLSTTYWPANAKPLPNSYQKYLRNIFENSKNIIRYYKTKSKPHRRCIKSSLKNGWLKCRNELLNESKLLLPNSDAEKSILEYEKKNIQQIEVVSNTVSLTNEDLNKSIPYQERKIILCVGHFCVRKNQLSLIRAIKGTSIKIVFVGGMRPMHKKYYLKCVKEAKKQHDFLGELKKEQIIELMGKAKAHICISKLETPGLVNIEAAMLGCNLLLPNVAPVKEYFGNYGVYLNNCSLDDIKKTLDKVSNTPPHQKLKKHVLNNYSFNNLVQGLKRIYSKLDTNKEVVKS